MTDPYAARLERFQAALRAADADVAVLAPGPNLYYLSGFFTEPWDRHFYLFVPMEGDPAFVIPDAFAEQVAANAWIDDRRTYGDDEDPRQLVEALAGDLVEPARTVLLDDQMWAVHALVVDRVFREASLDVLGGTIGGLRETKDATEIAAIERASRIADEVCADIRSDPAHFVGRTEREVAGEIESRLSERGSEGLPFEVVVSSGPNTSRVFHFHGDREIESGDPVTLDFGAMTDHYCSDQARVIVPGGEPSDHFVATYDAVIEAFHAGLEATVEGAPIGDIAGAANAVLADHDLLEHKLHRIGHGVGLTPHEAPNVIEDNERPIEEGMVFSIEPALYFEGEFGIRIEDLVVVEDGTARRLNRTDKTWRSLG